MNYLIEAEDVVEVAKSFLDCHPWDAAAESLIINMCRELFDVSQDRFIEMVDRYIK